jgi:hypothetical protein
MPELAFFTSQELIDELMRRNTFLGVVVHSEEEVKSDRWSGERYFKVHFNGNLDAPQACRLLGTVSEYMEGISS